QELPSAQQDRSLLWFHCVHPPERRAILTTARRARSLPSPTPQLQSAQADFAPCQPWFQPPGEGPRAFSSPLANDKVRLATQVRCKAGIEPGLSLPIAQHKVIL